MSAQKRSGRQTSLPLLKLNGKALDVNPPKPSLLKFKAFLDKAPADEVFTLDVVAENVGVATHTLRTTQRDESLEAYRHWHGKNCCMETQRR